MTVGEVMSRDVESCDPEDSLNRAAELMWNHDCGFVPVVKGDGTVVGVITDRDICMAAYTQGKRLSTIPVSTTMSKKVFSCAPSESLAAAEEQMRLHQVHRLPVTDGGHLVGILSLNDLALAAARAPQAKGAERAAVSETLAAICTHRPHEQHVAAA